MKQPYVLLEAEEDRIRVIEPYLPGQERVTQFTLDTLHGNSVSQLAYLRSVDKGYRSYPLAQGEVDGPFPQEAARRRLAARAQQFALQRYRELVRPRCIRLHGLGTVYVDIPAECDRDFAYAFLQRRNPLFAANWDFTVFGETHLAAAAVSWFPAEGLEALYERMEVAFKLLANPEASDDYFHQVTITTPRGEDAPPHRCSAGYRAMGSIEGFEFGIAVSWGILSPDSVGAEEGEEYRVLRDSREDEPRDCLLDGRPKRYCGKGIASLAGARTLLAGSCGVLLS